MRNNRKQIPNESCLYCDYIIYSEKDFKTWYGQCFWNLGPRRCRPYSLHAVSAHCVCVWVCTLARRRQEKRKCITCCYLNSFSNSVREQSELRQGGWGWRRDVVAAVFHLFHPKGAIRSPGFLSGHRVPPVAPGPEQAGWLPALSLPSSRAEANQESSFSEEKAVVSQEATQRENRDLKIG